MSETSLNVKLIAHTQLSKEYIDEVFNTEKMSEIIQGKWDVTPSKCVALTAIRTCYSHLKPSEIVDAEGEKYFGRKAADGEGGSEYDRLVRHIMRSKHTSTVEHLSYTFAVEGLSRSALAQLTRHRVGFSFSVQSQRYVKFGSDDKSGGFEYVVPPSVKKNPDALEAFTQFMIEAQEYYDCLSEDGIPSEDKRMLLPNAATCNLVTTANLRVILDFYSKRKPGRGAQWEIANLAEQIRKEVTKVDPWTSKFFEEI